MMYDVSVKNKTYSNNSLYSIGNTKHTIHTNHTKHNNELSEVFIGVLKRPANACILVVLMNQEKWYSVASDTA